jgi:aspartyl/asparaginyl beta-hydroxylase (cupin superfamily)
MKQTSHKLWFSLLNKNPYDGTELNYPDVLGIDGIKELELNYQIILDELNAYLKKFTLECQFNVTMVETQKSWKVRSLRVWGVEMYHIQKYFPKTLKLFSGIEGVVGISFNLLEPHAVIKPHFGDTNSIIRCHLGLIIPEENESCAIKVNNEIKCWQNGKVIGFTDAYNHEAWNKTDKQRIVLLFDILKPEYASKKNKICGVVLTSLYLQQVANFMPMLYSLNPVLLYPITYPLSFIMRCLIPIRNFFKK